MKAKLLTLIFTLTITTVLSSFGQDGKVYPGLMGVRLDSSQPVPDLYYDGMLNPSSTKSLRAHFPVIHDSINFSIRDGWVQVLDQNPNEKVEVKLLSNRRDRTGFSGWQTAWIGSTGASSVYQKLKLGSIGSDNCSAYYIAAKIPKKYSGRRSGVIRYQVVEKD